MPGKRRENADANLLAVTLSSCNELAKEHITYRNRFGAARTMSVVLLKTSLPKKQLQERRRTKKRQGGTSNGSTNTSHAWSLASLKPNKKRRKRVEKCVLVQLA